ncbi:MAG: hypothetical protein ACK5KR_01625 [Breznakia sp.]
MWDEFIVELKIKVLNALKRTFARVTKGKIIYKRCNKIEYCNVVRRRIGMINYAKETIQYTVNFMLHHEQKHTEVITSFKDGHDNREIKTEAFKKIESIFAKYNKRFKKEEFHDKEGNLYRIKHVYQRVSELEKNIRILMTMFFEEINDISLSVHLE